MSKIVKRDILENFGGGAKSDVAGIYLPSGFVPESLNVDFSVKGGAARKRKGYRRVKETSVTGSPTNITGIYEAKLGSITTRLVTAVTDAGAKNWYSWDGADTFTSLSTGGTFMTKNSLTDFCVSRTDTDGFVVIFSISDYHDIVKWDGYTLADLDVKGVNGGGDLGIDLFNCSYVASFKNHLFMANTTEGNDALADTWTQGTGAGGTPWPTTTYRFDTTFENEIFRAFHTPDGSLTCNDGNYLTLAEEEYDVYEKYLYVRCKDDDAPSTDIKLSYHSYERIRFSNLGDAEDHDPLNFIDIVTEPGKEIVRIKPLRDLLMVYKEDSIWAVYHNGDADFPFSAYCVDHNTPCYAGFSVVDIKGEHFFLGEEGIMKTNGAKVEPVLVSTDVPDWFKNINRDDWQYSYAAINPSLRQYRLLIPNVGGTNVSDKDREIRFDYEDGTWSEHKYAGNANVIAAINRKSADITWDDESRRWDDINRAWDDPYWVGGKPKFFYTGDYAGFVREHDVVEYDDEGATDAIEAYVITKPLNLAQEADDLDKNKRLINVRMRLDTGSGMSLDVYKKLDNGQEWTSVGAIDCDQPSTMFEGKINLDGTCKECQYKLGNNAATQPFCIYWLLTEYILRSEK